MILSTGKQIHANGNIFGVTRDGDLSEGYDCMLFDDHDPDDPPLLTPAEKVEIADEMIRRWTMYRTEWAKR
jgi:hypothetical protein